MRYESEILYDLMKRDGLLNPSQDNLPYESELKEKYVNEVEGAYPKLQDYRAEWLNYNKCEYIPADFPTESQTNQTSGVFENVVPYAYESAILKGMTETILDRFENGTYNAWSPTFIKGDNTKRIRTINQYSGVSGSITVSVNEKYEVNVVGHNTSTSTGIGSEWKTTLSIDVTNSIFAFVIRKKDGTDITKDEIRDVNMVTSFKQLTDMVSVKLPVLTTVGKNLFNKDNAYLSGTLNQNIRNDIFIKPNTTYTFYANENNWVGAYLYDKNDILTREVGNTKTTKSITFTTTSEEVKAVLQYHNGGNTAIGSGDFTGVQLEYGTQITSYEPYKSNILTTPEDLELRGIGDVQDTLDCLTGEVVQNIYEFTLDGSQIIDGSDGSLYYYLPLGVHNNKSISDKLPSITVAQVLGGTIGIAPQNRGNTSRLYINVDGITTKEELKNFFLNNPTTIQLILVEKSVKTVDLSCINECNAECDFIPLMGTMHYQTSSDTIPPLADLTVCVEATTQNLASFVALEGVEHNE